ncbi:MAG TPA: methyltransferase [Vicinamibacterales bacterium]|nr:methyltransferase [Vicinamibacterales bacterium]
MGNGSSSVSIVPSRLVAVLARRRVALGFLAGVVTLVLARPTWITWRVGLVVALIGETIRVWAAGHLEKSREVTRSGPYRWTSHPLYLGSSFVALGVIIAARSVAVGVVVAGYMAATTAAAIRTEEAFLRRTFGPAYDDYKRSAGTAASRRFSLPRALRNREYRAVIGLALGFGILALKIALSI